MKDESIKQAISAYLDGVGSDEENQLAQQSLRNPIYQAYYEDLQKLSSSLKTWNDENLSPDLETKLREIQKREGNPMKTLTKQTNAKIGAVVLMGLLAVVVFTHQDGQEVRLPAPTGSLGAITGGEMLPVPEPMPYNPSVQADVGGGYGYTSGASMAAGEFSSVSAPPSEAGWSAQERAFRLREMARESSGFQSAQLFGISSAPAKPQEEFHTENYALLQENKFLDARTNPLSTFSIDVDTASYANLRRFLNSDELPPKDAVRIEEMINYFHYDYPEPPEGQPFSIYTERGTAPWNSEHELVLIGLHGKSLASEKLAPSHLVFLIDTSGSMAAYDKLPLLKKGLKALIDQLSDNEKVSIVTYAGSAGLVLEATTGSQKMALNEAIENLDAAGSTAGSEGIQLAYEIAAKNFIKEGNNRVILVTDGDFNVGTSSDSELVGLIEQERGKGVFLTVLGFGTGNYQDAKMEQLANHGNGNFYYIDSYKEAQKVLVQELGSTLFTIAKDVKIQVDFNPSQVKAYRLIGYEDRVMDAEDFSDDKKDAGELGAGHTVTVLYEIIPAGSHEDIAAVTSQYQKTEIKESDDLFTVHFRYKEPTEDVSRLISKTLKASDRNDQEPVNLVFAGAVAEFGMLLRDSEFKGAANYEDVLAQLGASVAKDSLGYRAELVELVKKARSLAAQQVKGIQFKDAASS